MIANTKTRPIWLKILRWCARIIAILFVAFILMMFIGEGGFWSQPKGLPLRMRDYVLLSLFGLYVAGLVIGLWREGLGGLISLAFIVTHIVILSAEGIKNLTYFYVMLLPGILYLLSWYFHRRLIRQQQ
jgi:hypothetical protein